jgi:hypothetical protein
MEANMKTTTERCGHCGASIEVCFCGGPEYSQTSSPNPLDRCYLCGEHCEPSEMGSHSRCRTEESQSWDADYVRDAEMADEIARHAALREVIIADEISRETPGVKKHHGHAA